MATKGNMFERFSHRATAWTGSSPAFGLALGFIVIWLVTGPIFRFSDTWQLVINTSTTIVTFLMVFLIQRAQNKDGQAIQIKLNELIAAIEGASNLLIDAEDLTEKELEKIHNRFQQLADETRQQSRNQDCHSIKAAAVEPPPIDAP